MSKQFVKVIGNIDKDIPLHKVSDMLKFDTETLLNRNSTDKTKQIVVEITVKEIKDVV